MDENMMTAANVDEEIVESSPAVEETEVQEQTEPSAEAQPAPEPETNTQRVAKRIREASQKSVDDFVKRMGLVNPYDGDRPITTQAEYEAYAAVKRLDEAGESDPVAAFKNKSLEGEVEQLRANERMRQLESDPIKGETFQKLRDRVEGLMDYCRTNGTPCTVDAAFNAVLSESYFELMSENAQKAKTETLRKINANAKASPGALSSAGTNTALDYGAMSDADFDKMFQKALRGELRQR